MPGPIKPEEVQKKKIDNLPEEVFEVFNALILEDWNGSSSTVNQSEAAERIASSLSITKQQVYARNLLDVEDAYAEAGWNVRYDKPGFNENYEAYFFFKKSE